jgi:glycosyltransferase involved in cell wall biosynthesis
VDLVFLKGLGSLTSDFKEIGVGVEKIPFEAARDLPWAARGLANKVKAGGYDLVHSHLLKADLVSALSSFFKKPPLLVASKHNDERALLNPLFSFVHGIISSRAQRVIVLSDHVGRFVERHGRVPREKIARIYYGLDPHAFAPPQGGGEEVREELGLPEGVPVLTMVARFAEQKDHATLLRAARLLKEEGADFRLLLVGDDPFGDHRQRMEALSSVLDLCDRVIFTGVRQDVPRILAITTIFVMPSLWEGLGLVFLEAMASSLPVVSNRVSAVPEIVAHGETGILVPPGETDALKDALSRLIRDPVEAEKMGRAGRARLLSRFSLQAMVDDTEANYFQHFGYPTGE